jgi:hypothetical protein
MRTRPAILSLLLTIPALASEPWTTQDKVLEGAFIAAMAIDYRQTSDIHRTVPGRCPYYEQNVIMGARPSQAMINRYFLTTTALQIAAVGLLPSGKWRTMAQAFTLGVEVGAIGHNYTIGLKFAY